MDKATLVRDRHVLGIQAAIGWCLGGLGPVLVLGARDLDIARYRLSWLGSAFGFTLLATGFLGHRALRLGAARVVRIGAVLLAAGATLLGIGDSVVMLAAGGLLQGAGSSAFLIATPAMVGVDNRATRLAIAVGVSSVTGLLAPAAVALVDEFGVTGRIALLTPIVWLIPIVLGPGLSRTRQKDETIHHADTGFKGMTRQTWLRWMTLVLGVSAEFFFWTWGAARLTDGGLSDSAASGFAAAFAVGMAVGRFVGPRRLGAIGPLPLAATVTSLAALCVTVNVDPVVLVTALLAAGLGIAVIYPVALDLLLADTALREERLIALAAYASGVAITITPVFLGLLDQVMPIRYAFGLVPVLMVALVGISHPRPAHNENAPVR